MKPILSLLFIGLLLNSTPALAQNNTLNFEELTSIKTAELDNLYKDYKVFQADFSEIKKKLATEPSEATFRLGSEIDLEVELSPSHLLDSGLILSELRNSGVHLSDSRPSILSFKGHSDYGSIRLAINDDFIGGFITTAEGIHYLEQSTISEGLQTFVLVSEEDYLSSKSHSCAHQQSLKEKIDDELETLVTGNCFQIDLAIAADHSMYAKHGGAGDVIDHVVNTMNNVAANYELSGSSNFDDGVEFNLVEIQISTCAECDLWTSSTDVFDVLNDFRTWSKNGGFNATHQIGQFWTDRDFDGNYVGLADTGTNLFCNDGAYHVLQDFTTSTGFLRAMTAHEMGHNFNASHPGSAGYIMSSTLSNTSNWSSGTKSMISSEIALQGPACLDNCGAASCSPVTDVEVSNITSTGFDLSWNGESGVSYDIRIYQNSDDVMIYNISTSSTFLNITPSAYAICKNYKVEIEKNCGSSISAMRSIVMYSPMAQGCADFVPDLNVNYTGESISFTDMSMNTTMWDWDFGDGNTSSIQNPTHVYNSPGIYMVKLMVNNGAHEMEIDSLITILPDRNVPYSLTDGGSFDVSVDDFASQGLNGTAPLWELGIGTGPLSSSDNVWKTNLDGDIPEQDAESALYSPRFDFSTTANYVLEFEQSMETIYCNAPFALKLEYSVDNGASWTRLGSYGDTGPGINSWYNRGPSSSCPISTSVYPDETGWTFSASNVYSSYDVSFLSGNSQVIFRYLFKVKANFSGGYNADGSMINNFRITSSGVVALDLIRFEGEARDKYNLLNWEIAEMENFNYFGLEKSSNGIDFLELTRIKGEENKTSYLYEDQDVKAGLNYYRLAMYDMDGSVSYSDILKIEGEVVDDKFHLFPNPIATDYLNIDTRIDFDGVKIYSTSGQLIVQEGNVRTLNLKDFIPGVYVISFEKNNRIVNQQKLFVL